MALVLPERVERTAEEERELYGDPVTVLFQLAGGVMHEFATTRGNSIRQLKKHFCDLFGVEYDTLTLILAGKPMMDPLSLADIDGAKTETDIVFTVQLDVDAAQQASIEAKVSSQLSSQDQNNIAVLSAEGGLPGQVNSPSPALHANTEAEAVDMKRPLLTPHESGNVTSSPNPGGKKRRLKKNASLQLGSREIPPEDGPLAIELSIDGRDEPIKLEAQLLQTVGDLKSLVAQKQSEYNYTYDPRVQTLILEDSTTLSSMLVLNDLVDFDNDKGAILAVSIVSKMEAVGSSKDLASPEDSTTIGGGGQNTTGGTGTAAPTKLAAPTKSVLVTSGKPRRGGKKNTVQFASTVDLIDIDDDDEEDVASKKCCCVVS